MHVCFLIVLLEICSYYDVIILLEIYSYYDVVVLLEMFSYYDGVCSAKLQVNYQLGYKLIIIFG